VIQPVNDPPAFTSQPVTLAVVQEDYQYTVTTSDPDGDKVTVTAPVKPSWANLSTPGNNGVSRLHGRPPAGALGNFNVRLQASDGTATVEQAFVLYVNVRPVLRSLEVATQEDAPLVLNGEFFGQGCTDGNGNALQSVRITGVPASGKLLLAAQELKAGDTVAATSLTGLKYQPAANYFGRDAFTWNAYDGYHFSTAPARVDIVVVPVNDPPKLILTNDTLRYEVNGEPALVAEFAEIEDVDNDSLTGATVGFHPAGYRLPMDVLLHEVPRNLRAAFDIQSGILRFTGLAPLSDYRAALRSVRYVHQNTVDPLLEQKSIYFTLDDGESDAVPVDKIVVLQYTFVEFDIPSGFTPNGDQANDKWVIDRPGGGLEDMKEAIISVYNKQGVLVYRATGFDRPWDGTMNGELLPADTYYFTIDLRLRSKKTYRGVVTILR
jgi:gliding motility-associated-like protein